MHFNFILIIAFIPLLVMIVSDFRTRQIGVLWLVLFAILTLISGWIYEGGTAIAGHLKTNLAFLALLYSFLGIYVCVLRHRAFSSFHRAIGSGDLLFLLALSPLFEMREFVQFLTLSSALSLLGYGVLLKIRTSKLILSIPLVGTLGLCFIFYTTIRIWLK